MEQINKNVNKCYHLKLKKHTRTITIKLDNECFCSGVQKSGFNWL